MNWQLYYDVKNATVFDQTSQSMWQHRILLTPEFLFNDVLELKSRLNLSGVYSLAANNVNEAFDSRLIDQNLYIFNDVQFQHANLSTQVGGLQFQPYFSWLYAHLKFRNAHLLVGTVPLVWGNGLIANASLNDDFLTLNNGVQFFTNTSRTIWKLHYHKSSEGNPWISKDDKDRFGASLLFNSEQEALQLGFSWDYTTFVSKFYFHTFDLFINHEKDDYGIKGEFAYLSGTEEQDDKAPRYTSALPNHKIVLLNSSAIGSLFEFYVKNVNFIQKLSLKLGIGQGDLGDRKPDDKNPYYSTESQQFVPGLTSAGPQFPQPQLREGHNNRFLFHPGIRPGFLLQQFKSLTSFSPFQSRNYWAGRPQYFGQDYFSQDGTFLGNGSVWHQLNFNLLPWMEIRTQISLLTSWVTLINPLASHLIQNDFLSHLIGNELDISFQYPLLDQFQLKLDLGYLLPGKILQAASQQHSQQALGIQAGMSLQF